MSDCRFGVSPVNYPDPDPERKREDGRRNVFMTMSPRKNVPDVGIELGAACMPSELASERDTEPGQKMYLCCKDFIRVIC